MVTRGRRHLPWIKLWYDMLGDAKMNRLSVAEKGCWVGILLLAGQSPVRGKLMITEEIPMSESDIARALNLHSYEIRHLKSLLSKMIELKSLRWDDNDVLEVINFNKRQESYPSDFEDHRGEAGKDSGLSPEKLPISSELAPEKLPLEGEGRGKKQKKRQKKTEIIHPKLTLCVPAKSGLTPGFLKFWGK